MYNNSLFKMLSYKVELGSVTTEEDYSFSPVCLLNCKAQCGLSAYRITGFDL